MKDIIYAFVAHLINAFRFFLPGIVGKTLTALGIGLYVYNVAYPPLRAWVQSQASGLPALAFSYFGAIGLDVVATMWLSVYVVRIASKSYFGSLLESH